MEQGDSLGSLMFALGIHKSISSLKELWVNVWYADDGTLVGPVDALEKAFQSVIVQFATLGMELNLSKCILWCPPGTLEHHGPSILSGCTLVPFERGSGIILLSLWCIQPPLTRS